MPALLDRYLLSKFVVALIIAAPTLCAFVLLLQTMRLLPLVAHAGASLAELASIFGFVLVPLLVMTLPASMIISQQMVLTRLQSEGELLALSAAGVSRFRIALAPGLVALTVAIIAGALSLYGEPAVYGGLQRQMADLMVRSLLGRIEPGILVEPTPELTILAYARRGDQLDRIFIDDRRRQPAAQLYAQRATLAPLPGRAAVTMRLEEGFLHTREGRHRVIRAHFDRLEASFAFGDTAAELDTLFPARLAATPAELAHTIEQGDEADARDAALLLHRRLATAPGALGLCLAALALALLRPIGRRPWAFTLGATLVLGFHLLLRLGEAAVDAGRLAPAAGAWLPALVFWAALALGILLRQLRKVCFRSRGTQIP